MGKKRKAGKAPVTEARDQANHEQLNAGQMVLVPLYRSRTERNKRRYHRASAKRQGWQDFAQPMQHGVA